MMENPIYVLSDSIGETAELVVKAAVAQYNSGKADIRKIPYVTEKSYIDSIIEEVIESHAIVVFTIILPDIREYLINKLKEKNISYVDIMGPIMAIMSEKTQKPPKLQPGLVHKLDQEYFNRIEAIEFAVKYDDGKDPRGLEKADVVLVGISRTSKTPLSMYLAHKRFKVANVPIVPEVAPPEELFKIPGNKVVGLTINPSQLLEIRMERLKALGLTAEANYASMERIYEELSYAEGIMKRIGCKVINVSNRAVEETANKIIEIIRRGQGYVK
jgi:regulator of PEP synthase PpsR (kinase-PPPase family)